MSAEKLRSIEIEEVQIQLMDTERKFRKSCAQIHLLNQHLEDIKIRYQKAKADNYHRFRYNLRLKLACIEGVRNMYYEYAHIQAERVADLRNQLFGELAPYITDE